MRSTMKLLIQSAVVFFGTLFAAGLLALADPLITPGVSTTKASAPAVLLARVPAAQATAAQPQR